MAEGRLFGIKLAQWPYVINRHNRLHGLPVYSEADMLEGLALQFLPDTPFRQAQALWLRDIKREAFPHARPGQRCDHLHLVN